MRVHEGVKKACSAVLAQAARQEQARAQRSLEPRRAQFTRSGSVFALRGCAKYTPNIGTVKNRLGCKYSCTSSTLR